MVSAIALLTLAQVNAGASQKQKLLESKYQQLNHATEKLNASAVQQWISDNATSDFFLAHGGITRTKSQTAQMLKDQFLLLKAVKSSTFKLTNVAILPDHMSCSVRSHLDAVTKDNRRLVSDSVTVNTWKLVHKKWQVASMVITKQQTTANGKLLPVH